MPLRKASAYSKKNITPYTRKSSKSKKNYIKTVPENKITRFKMGEKSNWEKGDMEHVIKLVSGEKVQIRDNALEAARKYVLRLLNEKIPEEFYFEVKTYPHQILRENKVYSGASKGERVNTGMAQSFGSVMGRAAVVKKDKPVFLIALYSAEHKGMVNDALSRVKSKLPCKTRILYENREVEDKD